MSGFSQSKQFGGQETNRSYDHGISFLTDLKGMNMSVDSTTEWEGKLSQTSWDLKTNETLYDRDNQLQQLATAYERCSVTFESSTDCSREIVIISGPSGGAYGYLCMLFHTIRTVI